MIILNVVLENGVEMSYQLPSNVVSAKILNPNAHKEEKKTGGENGEK